MWPWSYKVFIIPIERSLHASLMSKQKLVSFICILLINQFYSNIHYDSKINKSSKSNKIWNHLVFCTNQQNWRAAIICWILIEGNKCYTFCPLVFTFYFDELYFVLDINTRNKLASAIKRNMLCKEYLLDEGEWTS